ncbi:hypothetical protein B0T13DRAFT_450919 [Neurospora crassa]|nr:hypothetical protein B0T13DRAFT_450919 [Neurospora crassa]
MSLHSRALSDVIFGISRSRLINLVATVASECTLSKWKFRHDLPGEDVTSTPQILQKKNVLDRLPTYRNQSAIARCKWTYAQLVLSRGRNLGVSPFRKQHYEYGVAVGIRLGTKMKGHEADIENSSSSSYNKAWGRQNPVQSNFKTWRCYPPSACLEESSEVVMSHDMGTRRVERMRPDETACVLKFRDRACCCCIPSCNYLYAVLTDRHVTTRGRLPFEGTYLYSVCTIDVLTQDRMGLGSHCRGRLGYANKRVSAFSTLEFSDGDQYHVIVVTEGMMDGAYTPTSLLPNPPFFLTKTYRILPPPGACASLVTPRFRKRRRRRRRLWGCTNRRIEQEKPTMDEMITQDTQIGDDFVGYVAVMERDLPDRVLWGPKNRRQDEALRLPRTQEIGMLVRTSNAEPVFFISPSDIHALRKREHLRRREVDLMIWEAGGCQAERYMSAILICVVVAWFSGKMYLHGAVMSSRQVPLGTSAKNGYRAVPILGVGLWGRKVPGTFPLPAKSAPSGEGNLRRRAATPAVLDTVLAAPLSASPASLPQCSGLIDELWAWRNPSSRKLSACLDGASIDPIGTIIAGRDSVSSFRKPHPVPAPLCFAWGQLRVPVPTLFRSSSRRVRRHGSSKLIRETNHRLPIDVAAGLMYTTTSKVAGSIAACGGWD